MVKKLVMGVQKFAPEPTDAKDQSAMLQRLAIKTAEASVYNGASIFSTGIKYDNRAFRLRRSAANSFSGSKRKSSNN